MTVHLEIPLTEFMPLAGAAALHGMDVATYAKSLSQASLQAASTRVADHATAEPEALPSPAPLIQPPPPFAPPVPATPAEEDALLANLGA